VRALITGGGGQLASDLQSRLGEQAVSLSRDQLDIADCRAVDRVFEQVAPSVVFNCAAFHNLDECESNPDRAWEVNVRAVQDLARRDAKLVHLSTNYVFDGRARHPYAEDDLPGPRSIYALTKLASEHAALAYDDSALVVRTAGLYGLQGSTSKGGNFVERMLARAREQGELTVVADQHLQPTFTADLARAVIEGAERGVTGVVHLTATDACSWHEFTETIIALAGLNIAVHPTSTAIPPGGIDRPLNGVLARPRADRLGLPALPRWRDALVDYMRRAGHAC
jgi:dTDP-4-dehydrorhamnose reductase